MEKKKKKKKKKKKELLLSFASAFAEHANRIKKLIIISIQSGPGLYSISEFKPKPGVDGVEGVDGESPLSVLSLPNTSPLSNFIFLLTGASISESIGRYLEIFFKKIILC